MPFKICSKLYFTILQKEQNGLSHKWSITFQKATGWIQRISSAHVILSPTLLFSTKIQEVRELSEQSRLQ